MKKAVLRWGICLMLGGFLPAQPLANAQAVRAWPILTRTGDRILEGGTPFRFMGLATPNLLANENQLLPDASNHFPDEFEIRDQLDALHRLGCRATRTFSLTVACPQDRLGEKGGGSAVPAYISGRRQYNEAAFLCLDRVLALAREYDVRVIIPFIASQSFPNIRGVDEFAQLSGKPGSSFWTDEAVKADFKYLLDFVLNRRNTVSGVRYKDDPAILAWQLGNEFNAYAIDRKLNLETWSPVILAWSKEMAAHIKRVDPNHLLAEAGGCDRRALLADPNIDLISTHLYEYWCRLGGGDCDLETLAARDLAECRGQKPLMVDEFGLARTSAQQRLMRMILREPGIAGGLLWAMRGHRRDGGWYCHNEGGTPVNSYHHPGFSVGFAYDETRVLDQLRGFAYAMRGQALPPIEKPSPAPVLARTGKGADRGLTWRGSTGASSYVIERATSAAGPWTAVATDLEDSVVAHAKTFESSPESAFPLALWHDENAPTDRSWFYRIKGVNLAGETDYSSVLEVRWESAKP